MSTREYDTKYILDSGAVVEDKHCGVGQAIAQEEGTQVVHRVGLEQVVLDIDLVAEARSTTEGQGTGWHLPALVGADWETAAAHNSCPGYCSLGEGSFVLYLQPAPYWMVVACTAAMQVFGVVARGQGVTETNESGIEERFRR